MSNGTDNNQRHVYKLLRSFSACIAVLQFAPAGLSLPVPANRARSCSTRSPTMTLARSIALHAAQKPAFPATREIFGLLGGARVWVAEWRNICRLIENASMGWVVAPILPAIQPLDY